MTEKAGRVAILREGRERGLICTGWLSSASQGFRQGWPNTGAGVSKTALSF